MTVSKEELEDMYIVQKMSIRNIAKSLKLTRGQIEGLIEHYGIETRSVSEAQKIRAEKVRAEKAELAKIKIKNIVGNGIQTNFVPVKRHNLLVPLALNSSDKDSVVTIVISDLHIGDANHLPQSYWSCISNAVEILRIINEHYNIKKVNLVLNGDIVSGRDVFRYQEFMNLVQRGHWQIFLAEIILKDTIRRFSEIHNIDDMLFLKGTHDTAAYNFVLYLKRMFANNTKYMSQGGLFDIGDPLGHYNVLFSHGYGWSDTAPISGPMLRDMLKALCTYRENGIIVDRVCTSHSHWISSNLEYGKLFWDVTGGFQKWELTIAQRPCGIIIYLFNNNEVVSIPIRPDRAIEDEEKSDPGLEYKNLVYYGDYLLKHLKEIENIEG